jgi:dolichyl-phosphate-mannose-protein mannosyltransferase
LAKDGLREEPRTQRTTSMTVHRFEPRSILFLLGAGLLLRLLLAYVVLPGSGYPPDLHWYSQWALAVSTVGPGEFYAQTDANYPPGYIYVLWLMGTASKAVAPLLHIDAQTLCLSLVKIPPILLDVGIGFLLYRICQRGYWVAVETKHAALMAAAIYLFNPVAIYDSSIWGQTDAAGAFIMVLGILALVCWPSEGAASIAVISLLIKPQFGLVLMPMIGVVLLRRHLFQNTPAAGSQVRSRSRVSGRDGPIRILTSAIVAVLVLYLLIIPFKLNLHAFLERLTTTAQQYPYLSVNAFNPWALVGSGKNAPLVFAGIGAVSRDDIPIIGPLTGVEIGATLLIGGLLLGMARLLWRSDVLSVVIVGSYLCLCFFVLPTRVHERYIFPVFAFASLLSALDRRWLWTTALLAVGSLMNVHAVLSQIGTENVARLPLGQFFRSPPGILLSITFQTMGFVFAAWALRSYKPRVDQTDTSLRERAIPPVHGA